MYDVAPDGWTRVVSEATMNDSQRCSVSEPGTLTSRRARTPRFILGLLVCCTFLAGASFACDRGGDTRAEAAAPEAVAAKATEATPAAAPAAAPAPAPAAGQPSYKEEGFELSLEAAGPFSVGKPAEAKVVLVAKSGFKVNDQYPFKLALNDAAGLEFPNKVVTRDAMTLEKHQGVMKVAFTPKTPGAHTLSGRFSFSVCTEERCLIEKRELSLEVTAK